MLRAFRRMRVLNPVDDFARVTQQVAHCIKVAARPMKSRGSDLRRSRRASSSSDCARSRALFLGVVEWQRTIAAENNQEALSKT
jgi:hypothetical protein